MLTSAQCRAKSEECAVNADDALTEAAVLEWETMALEWLKLAVVAEQQEGIEAELQRAKGGPDAPPAGKG